MSLPTEDPLAHLVTAANAYYVHSPHTAFLTLPEALDHVYKVDASSPYPKTFSEAMKRPDAQLYHQAACDEIQSLIDNGTWELARLPPGRKSIGCRWVFVIKRHSDGSIERYKARLVAKGYSQRPGFDYQDTFAPTAKWVCIRAILALAALEDLELESVDISSAYLNGELDVGSDIAMLFVTEFPYVVVTVT